MSVLSHTQKTIDHAEIQDWVREREGYPAAIAATAGDGDVGILRIAFSDDSSDRALRPISWDAWLAKFDAQQLAFEFRDGARADRSFRLIAR